MLGGGGDTTMTIPPMSVSEVVSEDNLGTNAISNQVSFVAPKHHVVLDMLGGVPRQGYLKHSLLRGFAIAGHRTNRSGCRIRGQIVSASISVVRNPPTSALLRPDISYTTG